MPKNSRMELVSIQKYHELVKENSKIRSENKRYKSENKRLKADVRTLVRQEDDYNNER